MVVTVVKSKNWITVPLTLIFRQLPVYCQCRPKVVINISSSYRTSSFHEHNYVIHLLPYILVVSLDSTYITSFIYLPVERDIYIYMEFGLLMLSISSLLLLYRLLPDGYFVDWGEYSCIHFFCWILFGLDGEREGGRDMLLTFWRFWCLSTCCGGGRTPVIGEV